MRWTLPSGRALPSHEMGKTHSTWLAGALFALLALSGCCTRPEALRGFGADAARANLVLGPSADHAWLAKQFTARAEGPAAIVGWRGEELTYYTRIHVDEQAYYDRYGSTFHTTQSVQTGVRIR